MKPKQTKQNMRQNLIENPVKQTLVLRDLLSSYVADILALI